LPTLAGSGTVTSWGIRFSGIAMQPGSDSEEELAHGLQGPSV